MENSKLIKSSRIFRVFLLGIFTLTFLANQIPQRVFAQVADDSYSIDLDFQNPASIKSSIKITLKNENPSILVGGYKFAVPFREIKIENAKLNDSDVDFSSSIDGENSLLDLNFKSKTLRNGDDAILTVNLEINNSITNSNGFRYFYWRRINADKKNYTFNLNNLNKVGQLISKSNPNSFTENSNGGLLLEWGSNINATLNIKTSLPQVLTEKYFINLPQNRSNQSIIFSSAFVDEGIENTNYYILTDKKDFDYTFNIRNNFTDIDFFDLSNSKINEVKGSFIENKIFDGSNLEKIQKITKFITQNFNTAFNQKINTTKEINTTSDLNSFGLAQVMQKILKDNGIDSNIAFGYPIFFLGSEIQPGFWIEANLEGKIYCVDPYNEINLGIDTALSNCADKAFFGYYIQEDRDNFLGMANSQGINATQKNFKDIPINPKLDLDIFTPKKVGFGESFKIKYIINNSGNQIHKIVNFNFGIQNITNVFFYNNGYKKIILPGKNIEDMANILEFGQDNGDIVSTLKTDLGEFKKGNRIEVEYSTGLFLLIPVGIVGLGIVVFFVRRRAGEGKVKVKR